MGMALAVHRFTADQFHRMGEAGVFHEGDRVELIDGQIVEMTPIGPRHAGCVKELAGLLYRATGGRVVLSVQDPLVLGTHQAPEPDVAVLERRPGGYRTRHPGPDDVLLVIEVADTSVEYDRSTKIPRYARAGVPEAWLVNLPAEVIEVYRGPVGGRYTGTNTVSRGATIQPLELPGVELTVDEILG